jgi:hypothetical protein
MMEQQKIGLVIIIILLIFTTVASVLSLIHQYTNDDLNELADNITVDATTGLVTMASVDVTGGVSAGSFTSSDAKQARLASQLAAITAFLVEGNTLQVGDAQATAIKTNGLTLCGEGGLETVLQSSPTVGTDVSTYTLPGAYPSSAGFLQSDAAGLMTWGASADVAMNANLDGLEATPSFSFASDQTVGLYLANTTDVGMSVGGVNAATLSATGLAVVADVSCVNVVATTDVGCATVTATGDVSCDNVVATTNVGCATVTATGDVGCVTVTASGAVTCDSVASTLGVAAATFANTAGFTVDATGVVACTDLTSTSMDVTGLVATHVDELTSGLVINQVPSGEDATEITSNATATAATGLYVITSAAGSIQLTLPDLTANPVTKNFKLTFVALNAQTATFVSVATVPVNGTDATATPFPVSMTPYVPVVMYYIPLLGGWSCSQSTAIV